MVTAYKIAATVDLMEAGTRSWDVIVLGAGPAGSLAAAPDWPAMGPPCSSWTEPVPPRPKVCGGCLPSSRPCPLFLPWVLADWWNGAAPCRFPVWSWRFRASERVSSSGKGSFSREVFDAALLKAAIEAGEFVFCRKRTPISLPFAAQRVPLALNRKGQEAVARGRVVLGADGLGGGLLAGQADGRAGVAAGFAIRRGSHAAAEFPACFAPGTVYMACGKGGYVGLVRTEDGRLNIAAALDAAFVKRAGGLGSASAAILREAGFASIEGLATLSWHGTPMLTRHASRPATERVFLLGDAASYVEPFSGEGMAWAMNSAVAVVPFALRACREWHSSLVRQWSMRLPADDSQAAMGLPSDCQHPAATRTSPA